MDTTEVNVPLLRKVVEWAETEAQKPRELCQWFQGTWVLNPKEMRAAYDCTTDESYYKSPECGTCFCIAGYTGQIAGTNVVYDGRFVDGMHVSDFAQSALGLTDQQAEDLFYADNTIEDIRCIAEEIAGERL